MSQTQQNLVTFYSVLGQHVLILIESSSGPSKIQILTSQYLKWAVRYKRLGPHSAFYTLLIKDLYLRRA